MSVKALGAWEALQAERDAALARAERAEAKVAALREALERIANDPHCAYYEGPYTGDTDMQYRMGVTDGHRCAAQKARDALAKASEDES